jgi:hypothetical protein
LDEGQVEDGLGDTLMKIVVKMRDAVALAKRFEASPREALRES